MRNVFSAWRGIGSCIALMASACGDTAWKPSDSEIARTQASQHLSPTTGGTFFDGSLVKAPFVVRQAIWGIEKRQSAGHGASTYNVHDLVVLLSNSADPCADYPRILAADGHMAFVVRMSKLVRHAGSAVFVEPDAGRYNVEQPHGNGPAVSRGAEFVFRAMTTERGDIPTWLASLGAVELAERESISDVVRGTFNGEMVPFSLEEEPTGPQRSVRGEFVAVRCARMDEAG